MGPHRAAAEELGLIDPGQASIIHSIFPQRPADGVSFVRSYLVPYLGIVLVIVVIPLAVAGLLLSREVTSPPEATIVAFSTDAQCLCCLFVTLPVLLIMLRNDRVFLPQSIASVTHYGALSVETDVARAFRLSWERQFRRSNLMGQAIAAVVFAGEAIGCSLIWQSEQGTWLAVNGGLTMLGRVFLWGQNPLFWSAVTVYIVRYLTTIALLHRLSGTARIRVLPFHPDGCGGLKPIGGIGLRNQLLLSVAGINIAFAIVNHQALEVRPESRLRAKMTALRA